MYLGVGHLQFLPQVINFFNQTHIFLQKQYVVWGKAQVLSGSVIRLYILGKDIKVQFPIFLIAYNKASCWRSCESTSECTLLTEFLFWIEAELDICLLQRQWNTVSHQQLVQMLNSCHHTWTKNSNDFCYLWWFFRSFGTQHHSNPWNFIINGNVLKG